MIYGYARVSTDGQDLASQLAQLRAAGAERVWSEKISGAMTDRRALAAAIKALGPGDTLLVTRLDRLARSVRDLHNVLAEIAEAGASFKSLADIWADTTTPHVILIAGQPGSVATGGDKGKSSRPESARMGQCANKSLARYAGLPMRQPPRRLFERQTGI